jgi:hypothetical protein
MPEKAKETGTPDQEKQKSVSRRQLLRGGGAGLVVGGALGYDLLPRPKEPLLAEATVWIGRNLESCSSCRLCQLACFRAHSQG